MSRFRPKRAAVLAAVTVLSVAGLVGCSDKDGGTASSPGSTGPGAGKVGTGGPAQVATVDPDKVLARQTFKLRRTPEDTVEVGVVSLVVTGKVATLTLVMTPRFKSVPADMAVSVYDIYENGVFGPYLLDLANLKRYDVVRSGPKELASDSVHTETVNGTPMSAYAVFAAPQDGATEVDVHIADWWPAFKAVPVQR
ncbi:MAG: hypothetical protein KY458_11285 [Actinobacteria bacterium]|nr:hypothetical protein [Actinomycetota bacterium]